MTNISQIPIIQGNPVPAVESSVEDVVPAGFEETLAGLMPNSEVLAGDLPIPQKPVDLETSKKEPCTSEQPIMMAVAFPIPIPKVQPSIPAPTPAVSVQTESTAPQAVSATGTELAVGTSAWAASLVEDIRAALQPAGQSPESPAVKPSSGSFSIMPDLPADKTAQPSGVQVHELGVKSSSKLHPAPASGPDPAVRPDSVAEPESVAKPESAPFVKNEQAAGHNAVPTPRGGIIREALCQIIQRLRDKVELNWVPRLRPALNPTAAPLSKIPETIEPEERGPARTHTRTADSIDHSNLNGNPETIESTATARRIEPAMQMVALLEQMKPEAPAPATPGENQSAVDMPSAAQMTPVSVLEVNVVPNKAVTSRFQPVDGVMTRDIPQPQAEQVVASPVIQDASDVETGGAPNETTTTTPSVVRASTRSAVSETPQIPEVPVMTAEEPSLDSVVIPHEQSATASRWLESRPSTTPVNTQQAHIEPSTSEVSDEQATQTRPEQTVNRHPAPVIMKMPIQAPNSSAVRVPLVAQQSLVDGPDMPATVNVTIEQAAAANSVEQSSLTSAVKQPDTDNPVQWSVARPQSDSQVHRSPVEIPVAEDVTEIQVATTPQRQPVRSQALDSVPNSIQKAVTPKPVAFKPDTPDPVAIGTATLEQVVAEPIEFISDSKAETPKAVHPAAVSAEMSEPVADQPERDLVVSRMQPQGQVSEASSRVVPTMNVIETVPILVPIPERNVRAGVVDAPTQSKTPVSVPDEVSIDKPVNSGPVKDGLISKTVDPQAPVRRDSLKANPVSNRLETEAPIPQASRFQAVQTGAVPDPVITVSSQAPFDVSRFDRLVGDLRVLHVSNQTVNSTVKASAGVESQPTETPVDNQAPAEADVSMQYHTAEKVKPVVPQPADEAVKPEVIHHSRRVVRAKAAVPEMPASQVKSIELGLEQTEAVPGELAHRVNPEPSAQDVPETHTVIRSAFEPRSSDALPFVMAEAVPNELELAPEPITVNESPIVSQAASMVASDAAPKVQPVEQSSMNSPILEIPPVRFIDQVVRAVRVDIDEGRSEMNIRLDPPDLGRLHVRLTSENGVVTAGFHAETEGVQALLEANLPALRQSLSNAGVQVQQLNIYTGAEFNQSASQHMGEQPAQRHRRSSRDSESTASLDMAAPAGGPSDVTAVDFLA